MVLQGEGHTMSAGSGLSISQGAAGETRSPGRKRRWGMASGCKGSWALRPPRVGGVTRGLSSLTGLLEVAKGCARTVARTRTRVSRTASLRARCEGGRWGEARRCVGGWFGGGRTRGVQGACPRRGFGGGAPITTPAKPSLIPYCRPRSGGVRGALVLERVLRRVLERGLGENAPNIRLLQLELSTRVGSITHFGRLYHALRSALSRTRSALSRTRSALSRTSVGSITHSDVQGRTNSSASPSVMHHFATMLCRSN